MRCDAGGCWNSDDGSSLAPRPCKLRCPEGQRRSAAGTWCEAGAGKPKCDLGHCGGKPEAGMAKCDMAAAAQLPAPPSDGASKRCYLYANGIEKLPSAGEKQLQRKNLKNELQQENLLQVGDGRRRRSNVPKL